MGQMLGIQLGNSTGAVLTCFLAIGVSFWGCWVLATAALVPRPLAYSFFFTYIVPSKLEVLKRHAQVFLPFCALLSFLVAIGAARNEPEAEAAYAAVGHATSEAATSIRTVRALGAEERTLELIDVSLNRLTELNAAKAWKLGLSLALNLSIFPAIFLAGLDPKP